MQWPDITVELALFFREIRLYCGVFGYVETSLCRTRGAGKLNRHVGRSQVGSTELEGNRDVATAARDQVAKSQENNGSNLLLKLVPWTGSSRLLR